MTEENTQAHRLPAEVIREDRDLEQSVESVSERLARLRWHWTLDESNPKRVGFTAYGRDVGRDEAAIRKYARAYESFSEGAFRNISEAIERTTQGETSYMASVAVGESYNMAPGTARRWHKDDVKEVKHAIEDERERREEQGMEFPAEEREDYAKRVAKMKADSRKAEQRHREEQRRNHSFKFMEMDALASKVRQASKELLDVTREVDFSVFSEEEVRLLERQIVAAHEMVGLTRTALSGDSGTDWDQALADLEEKRQYG